MLNRIKFFVHCAAEPGAGLRSMDEEITVSLRYGESDINRIDFVDALRFAISDYYNATRVETEDEYNQRTTAERRFMGED